MTLTKLLEIKRNLLPSDSDAVMHLADRIWHAKGCPTDRRKLSDVLEIVLTQSAAQGLAYPPILLKRRKQLEGGEWTPPTDAPSSNQLGGRVCSICGGRGWVPNPGGFTGTLCKCKRVPPARNEEPGQGGAKKTR